MILLIKNGHVINPATETDEVADILAEDGKVVKMEKNIKAKADRVIDAKGCYVMPALSFPCLLLLRLWSIPMLRRLQWYGAILGSLCSICSSLSVRSKWQTVL